MEKCEAHFSCLFCAFPVIQQSSEGALHHIIPSRLMSAGPRRLNPVQMLWTYSGSAKAELQQSESVWWAYQINLWF